MAILSEGAVPSRPLKDVPVSPQRWWPLLCRGSLVDDIPSGWLTTLPPGALVTKAWQKDSKKENTSRQRLLHTVGVVRWKYISLINQTTTSSLSSCSNPNQKLVFMTPWKTAEDVALLVSRAGCGSLCRHPYWFLCRIWAEHSGSAWTSGSEEASLKQA